jgi:NAD+ diphosphatase
MAARGVTVPGFTGADIDRADALRLDAGALRELIRRGSARLLQLAELDPMLDDDGRLRWSGIGELEVEAELIFLGLEGEAPLFAPLVRPAALGQRAWGVFRLLGLMNPRDAAIWGAARSLIEWHNRHFFCGVCGAATTMFRAGWGRRCAGCTTQHFPRVDPVVIMLAEHRGRALLGRQPQYPQGRYSALAGFVEPGESIEEAVARELYEEAGVKVGNVRYVASQPWPFPGSLMIACFAEAESDALLLDDNELEDAMWVNRKGVAAALAGEPAAPFLAPPPFAIANTLLRRWIEQDS